MLFFMYILDNTHIFRLTIYKKMTKICEYEIHDLNVFALRIHDGFGVLSGTAFTICLFTVFQNTVPLATLWNRNLRIIMICPSTATFLGIMICPQCGDHPLHRHEDCPTDLIKDFGSSLKSLPNTESALQTG